MLHYDLRAACVLVLYGIPAELAFDFAKLSSFCLGKWFLLRNTFRYSSNKFIPIDFAIHATKDPSGFPIGWGAFALRCFYVLLCFRRDITVTT